MTATANARTTNRYEPAEIESRWQARWDELGMHRTDLDDGSRPRYYVLTMYDYPSGDLHIGHWFVKVPTDVISRHRRMQGYNVFFPVGFDAFGLPAENAAIRSGVQPREWTLRNVEKMRRQLRTMGATWDWDAEVITCEPEYYRWNQWFFLRFLENDLAYRQMAPVDWCPNDGVLAREQVEGADRVCWRCGARVTKRDLEQWFFRTTKYADELLDHSSIEWPEPIVVMQRNWIGRSEGAEITFAVAPDDSQPGGDEITVFTTRPDTLFGATFMVLAPEHPLVDRLTHASQLQAVESYRQEARRKSEIDRLSTDRDKSGVALGAHAINPINGERIPIWIADYVLVGYGTGAIMAVPAHDERDFEFARWAGLPVRRVVARRGEELEAAMSEAYAAHSNDEVLVNSGDFSGYSANDGGRRITAELERRGLGRPAVTYRLRDWLISRQRPWGTPIPVIYCQADPSCGIVPVPDEELPVRLPDTFDYAAGGSNPLVHDAQFVNAPCPRCGGAGRRETDTMDTFVDSSWYWWRYLSPGLTSAPLDRQRADAWCPVDQYTGGAEHAVMHLLYSRWFTKALNDMGLVSEREPFKRLFNQGQILGADGERMSKSRGNVQDPDELVARYGADTVRLFLMFMGPWDQGGPWSDTGIDGVHRFLRRAWTVVLDPHGREPGDAEGDRMAAGVSVNEAADDLRRQAHRTLQKVTEDHANFRWNTMIAALMELTNRLMRLRGTEVAQRSEYDEAARLLVLMLAPLAPHIAEELWSRRLAAAGEEWRSVHSEGWPEYRPELVAADQMELPIQVNGRLRDTVSVPAGLSEIELEQIVLSRDKVRAYLVDAEVARIVHVPGRLVNLVTRPRA
ncbi:MAG TPA: leucine--tRNA ligase [Candidatus Limnocylindrales bacterium]|nr:leucine--tRNA ligase [Candidatus Limnocylindrales bacterium]